MGAFALVGLGSNLGDRKAHLDAAVAEMGRTPEVRVLSVSRYHETLPVGGPKDQGAFLNAAAALETERGPLELLRSLQAIEKREGRVRDAHWGARTLDLDLLLYGDLVADFVPRQNRINGGLVVDLRVPHPWLPFRRFVLEPLSEIAPGAVDPRTGQTVAQLLANLDRRPSYVAIFNPSPPFRESLIHELSRLGARSAAIHLGKSLRRRVRDELPIEALVEQFLAEIPLTRWCNDPPTDGWIVSDDWFDPLAAKIPEVAIRLNPFYERNPRWELSLERFIAVRNQLLPPTFVVVASSLPPKIRSEFLSADIGPGSRSTPMLEVDAWNRESIVDKVVIACAAARPDLGSTLGPTGEFRS